MDNVSGTEFGTIGWLACPEPDDELLWGWAYAAAQGAVKCTRLPIGQKQIGASLHNTYSYLYTYSIHGTYPLIGLSYGETDTPGQYQVTDKSCHGSGNVYGIKDTVKLQGIWMRSNTQDAVYWRYDFGNGTLDGMVSATLWTSFVGP